MPEIIERLKVEAVLSSQYNFSGFLFPLKKMLLLAFAFLSKLSFQKANIILMYHSINSNGSFHNVELKEFIRQMEYLRKNYAIVSLDDIVFFIKNGKDTSRESVAITFDDGYQDFYLNILYYIHKNRLPVTIFVTTGYVGKEWPFSSNQSKMLIWEEIKELSANNVEIGAHTVTHPNLQQIEMREAEKEILKSKEEIEKHIEKRVKFFSYPFGRYNNEIIDIVKSSGFEAALGGGGTIRKEANLFALNRIQVDSSVSFLLFKAKLTRAVDWYNAFEKIGKRFLQALDLVK